MFIPKLKLDKYTYKEQFEKILEEVKELGDEVLITKDKKNMILEAWDVIFATFNFLFKIATTKEIIKGYKDTADKLKSRNYDGKIIIDEYIEID